MVEFDRIVPIINPRSSNIRRARGYLEDLYDAYPTFYDRGQPPIETTPDLERTIERIQAQTRPGDLVPVLGGDGTISAAAQAITGRDIVMLTTWAGNGNDGSRDLNGEPGERPIHQLIQRGQTVAVYPMTIAIDSLRRQAINYFEFGCNPKGARLLNSPAWRRLPGYRNDHIRNLYEYAALPPTAFFSRRIPVTEAGATRHLVNFSAIRSHYLAKHALAPVRLSEPRAFTTEVRTQPGLLPWAYQAVRGNLRGDYLEKGQVRSMHIGRTVLYHIDAEPDTIERGSQLSISLAETPFYAVSTRP